MQMLKPNAYIQQLSRNEITVTSLQNSSNVEYLRYKQTNFNAHGVEGNEMNKDGRQTIWKCGTNINKIKRYLQRKQEQV